MAWDGGTKTLTANVYTEASAPQQPTALGLPVCLIPGGTVFEFLLLWLGDHLRETVRLVKAGDVLEWEVYQVPGLRERPYMKASRLFRGGPEPLQIA